jgi:hypothetical protein
LKVPFISWLYIIFSIITSAKSILSSSVMPQQCGCCSTT